MNDAIQKEQEVLVEAVVQTLTVMIGQNTIISGAELVPDKLLGILDYVLKKEDTGVASITFRNDDQPKGKLGLANPLMRGCVINMEHIFMTTLDCVEKEDFYLNLNAAVWLAAVDNVLHEIHHVAFAYTDPKAYAEYLETGKLVITSEKDPDNQKEFTFEDICEEYSAEMICQLANELDIEPPAIADMGHYGVQMMALFTDKDIMKDSKALRKSQRMLEQGVVYEDSKEEVYHKTLREYVRNTIAPEEAAGSEDWEQPVALINIRTEQEDGSVVVDVAAPVAAVDSMQELMNAANPQPITPEVVSGTVPQTMAFAGAGATTSLEEATAGAIDPAQEFVGTAGVDTVVLPEAVQATIATAATNAAGPTMAAAPKTFENKVEIAPDKMALILQQVYMRLYTHMFAKCGWSQNPATGKFHFAALDAVTQSVDISDIFKRIAPEATGLIAEYITVSPQGQDGYLEPCQGYVRGLIYRQKQLPSYQIFLNIGGNRICRKLVPQNPEKMNASNAYSKPAQEAQQGHARCYVMDGDLSYDAPWDQKLKAEIVNNEYIPKG